MNAFDVIFFGVCTVLVLVGGIITVAAKNPIRSVMGLLTTIIGIAGMYLQLSAEFLAAIQIIVYAGAVVVLFLFVIMLLGPQATTAAGTAGTKPSRYFGAAIFLLSAAGAMSLLWRTRTAITPLPKAPPALGTIEGIGRELFTTHLVPFELSGALLLVAVVGAVAVARGKQADPTRDAPRPPLESEAAKGPPHQSTFGATGPASGPYAPSPKAAVTGTADSHSKEAG